VTKSRQTFFPHVSQALHRRVVRMDETIALVTANTHFRGLPGVIIS
jgi:hypothetical protein